MTKTIYFQTNTDLDIRALTTIGVSVKGPGSIGFFGSGFKYALATLLRTGHEIWVQERYAKRVKFESKSVTIRDKPFSLVTCDGAELGFTTDMGPRWEPWMALRELIANTKDENGVYGLTQLPNYRYTIAVTGAPILEAWKDVDSIFLPDTREPIMVCSGLEVYRNFSPFVFYKGMRAGVLEPKSIYTYNILCDMQLTEERTLASPNFSISSDLRECLFNSRDPEIITQTLCAPKESFEQRVDLNYYWQTRTETFDETAKALIGNASANTTLLGLYRKQLEIANIYTLTPEDEKLLCEAWTILEFMGHGPTSLNFIKSKSADLLGRVYEGKIFISNLAFRDLPTLVGTIYEELVHKETGLADYTSGFQNYLVDQIVKYAMMAKARS